MLTPLFIRPHAISCSICLVLLFIGNSILIASEGQSGTNDILKAVQEATDSKYLKAKVTVKGFELNADVPTTNELMSKGLAVKNQLKENEAMLFVYEKPGKYSFWMKDMKFPIDIMWIGSNGKIVHIEENLEPCPLAPICPSYSPSADSQYVLETLAGFTQRHNISIGTNIDLSWSDNVFR